MPKLLIKHPEKGDLSYTLSGNRISVGRRAENAIQINHVTVSGSHAEIVAVNGHYVLRDLESTNHSFVNGEPIKEVDLKDQCKITFGTVECDYFPDQSKITGPLSDVDTPRKNVGILRSQNEELLNKLAEQQNQIDILGSAKFAFRSKNAGSQDGAADAELADRLKSITAQRDALLSENAALKQDLERLKALMQAVSDAPTSSALKSTVPIKLGPSLSRPQAPLTLTPDGLVRTTAPAAKVAASPPNSDILKYYTETVAKIRPLVSSIATETEARNEMLLLAKRLTEKAGSLDSHPAARMGKALEGLVRDISHREKELDPSVLRTITHAVDAMAQILEPAHLEKCENLPTPSVLALDDDADFLPALVAALEFAYLPATGCAGGTEALSVLADKRFDLIILDLSLPDVNGLDVCAAIRNFPIHEKTPILFLTGHDNIETRALTTMHGSNDFLAKPVNLFELTLRAYTWVYKHQLCLK